MEKIMTVASEDDFWDNMTVYFDCGLDMGISNVVLAEQLIACALDLLAADGGWEAAGESIGATAGELAGKAVSAGLPTRTTQH